MPKYRRYRKKSTSRWRRYGRSALSTASKALSVAKYVKSLVNVEYKHEDFSADADLKSTGTVLHVNAVAQGDDADQRSGDSIRCKSLQLRQTLKINETTPTDCFVRMMIFIDRQQIADTAPTIADVLNTGFGIPSNLNGSTLGRFKILMDKVINLTTSGTGWKAMKKYMKLNLPTRYNGSLSSDIQRNGLFVAWFSDEDTNPPKLNYEVRLGYVDN